VGVGPGGSSVGHWVVVAVMGTAPSLVDA
jgi:hypothetical protein